MKIIYIKHSCFMIETAKACFLFDYSRGDIPELPAEKPLYVFVSHAHEDHWNRGIFTDRRLNHACCYILGFDIREPFGEMIEKDPALKNRPVTWAIPQETVQTDDFICEPLLSTDEGVAFLVRTEEEVIYHAGDLNWWHWNGDPEERNLEREKNFKKEVDRLKGISIDAAFVPLDPRQENAGRFCMDYCMEVLDASHVFPMHFWKKYDYCKAYQESLKLQHPDWYRRFQLITKEGETFNTVH
ncbi:MAG: MBL fold metallo-hydrolase [Eubacterium sp.]|nr:MBL fold metallo-hydrolase [Eubacterium sp.]